MNADPQKVRSVFLAAVENHAPDQWSAYLDEACGPDQELRQRVEVLLRAHEQANSLLDAPVGHLPSPPWGRGLGERGGEGAGGEGAGPTIDDPITERPGTVIGPYKLLQQIGEGGMGTVYMAEQSHPVQRKVALKIIKPGMDSRQVIARFEAERQALAMMDHVNIARVLDAGMTGSEPGGVSPGRPYFVMELVHGIPITKYCDDNHLTPRQRLELFVPVCQAIQHAHQKGIIHRDIKPSNVMVTLYDGKPVPKVIDFGVAKATEQKLTERTLFTQYGTMVGTLEYMSPEQAEMSALGVDTRSDIYSLGVLLYELLTGSTPLTHKRMKEAAFAEILRMIKEDEPPKPSTRLSDSGEALATISANRHMEPAKLTKLVRGELDWIVMKALEKDRNRRYETANGFAIDVQRYLVDEPVVAGPPSRWYRLRKFARRHRRAVVAASLVMLALLGGIAGTSWGWSQASQAERKAEQNARAFRREALIQEIQKIRLTPHEAGWSQRAWDLVERAATIRADTGLRDQAAGALAGLDAIAVKTFEKPSSSVAWDALGTRLITGGFSDQDGRPTQAARVWDSDTDRIVHVSERGGAGPVGFHKDGTPLQLSVDADDCLKLILWNVAENRPVREFTLAAEEKPQPLTAQNFPTLALAADGRLVAASARLDKAKPVTRVWEVATGNQLAEFPQVAIALALSPDGELLALGDERGTATVWSVPQGKRLAVLPVGRSEIHSLAFGPETRRRELAHEKTAKWLLAVGDAGGTLSVWDLTVKLPRTICHGSSHHIFAIAFAPDGTTIASAGRGRVKLWEVATGRFLIDVAQRDLHSGLAFAPGGERLAISSAVGSAVVHLEGGRGLSMLRGLTSPVVQVRFSPDGRLVAALAHNWETGIWQASTGRLLHVLETPKGVLADNAGFAFSHDSQHFAFASGRRATLYSVISGKMLKQWTLPTGFVDHLAFDSEGKKLMSFRVETEDPDVPPYATSHRKYPRICRIRDLLGPTPLEPVLSQKDFDVHVFAAVATQNGRYVFVDGLGSGPDGIRRMVKAFDGSTGKEIWSVPSQRATQSAMLSADCDGKQVAVYMDDLVQADGSWRTTLLDVRNGKPLEVLTAGNTHCFSRKAKLLAGRSGAEPYGVVLQTWGGKSPLVTVGLNIETTSVAFEFDAAGTSLAWGNRDGTVSLCHIPELRSRLEEVGLGW